MKLGMLGAATLSRATDGKHVAALDNEGSAAR